MDSPVGERSRTDKEARHGVEITKNVQMGAKEVIQAQFKAVLGLNPRGFAGRSDWPLQKLSGAKRQLV
ncbi:MAG: hypothetical protein HY717_20890 [Planctomycetes bacterium]|nr:hypothetical protein [Planctomycetota bacterium]